LTNLRLSKKINKIKGVSLFANVILMNVVGIIMGSDSDLKIMEAAAEILKQFQVEFEMTIVSAHRTPLRMVEYATNAQTRGLKIIIAGAGGAAHLPGMIASITTLPVIGVPIKSSNSLDGWDSILSILQMPNGVPVATVALNAAKNAGILAVEMLAIADASLTKKLLDFKTAMKTEVETKATQLGR
jgi:5-(carboxyamino)imidazole ribonucleotide mutase